MYEEAGSDFHQVAYFRTRIGLRNALQEEISGSVDKEAVLITLNRPTVFAQPVAFDRGVFSLTPPPPTHFLLIVGNVLLISRV